MEINRPLVNSFSVWIIYLLFYIFEQGKTNMSEFNKTILSLINKKELKGFRFIYDNYYPSLCNYARKIIDIDDVVEDIVQDVIMKLWKGKTNFTDKNALTTFMYRSVRNSCLNHIRDSKKYNFSQYSEIEDISNDRFEGAILQEEYYRLIYIAINKLSDQRKEIILMSMQGMRNLEIAEELNVSVNTVKTLKKKAYSFLKEQLGDQVFLLFISLL